MGRCTEGRLQLHQHRLHALVSDVPEHAGCSTEVCEAPRHSRHDPSAQGSVKAPSSTTRGGKLWSVVAKLVPREDEEDEVVDMVGAGGGA